MARGLNHVYLLGSLVRDPELRYTASGLATLNFTVAGEDEVSGEDGQLRTLPWYHRCGMLGQQSVQVAELKAGELVFVEGALSYRAWETKEGDRRSTLDVKALRVEVATPGHRGGDAVVTDRQGGTRLRKGVNQTWILGNLTRDPELRYTSNGVAVIGLDVAVNERFQDRSKQWQERTHFVRATAWRTLAEACAEAKKGDPVLVSGRLRNNQWTDKSGQQRNTLEIEADRVEFLARGPIGGGQRVEQGARRAGPSNLPDIDDELPPEEDMPF